MYFMCGARALRPVLPGMWSTNIQIGWNARRIQSSLHRFVVCGKHSEMKKGCTFPPTSKRHNFIYCRLSRILLSTTPWMAFTWITSATAAASLDFTRKGFASFSPFFTWTPHSCSFQKPPGRHPKAYRTRWYWTAGPAFCKPSSRASCGGCIR